MSRPVKLTFTVVTRFEIFRKLGAALEAQIWRDLS